MLQLKSIRCRKLVFSRRSSICPFHCAGRRRHATGVQHIEVPTAPPLRSAAGNDDETSPSKSQGQHLSAPKMQLLMRTLWSLSAARAAKENVQAENFMIDETPLSLRANSGNAGFHIVYVTPASRVGSHYYKVMQEMTSIEAQALDIGREVIRRSKDQIVLRRIFRRLFDQCYTLDDIRKVLAIALQKQPSTKALEQLQISIVHALFRARAYSKDREIFSFYCTLLTRFEKSGVRSGKVLYWNCVKFAARSRDPAAMQRALWLMRSRKVEITTRLFRSIIAKFSIGFRGFGELRNGRWRKKDLLQVLLGFPGTLSGNPTGAVPDHHLSSFMDRSDPLYLKAFIQILAHCKAPDVLWEEWELWRNSELRVKNEAVEQRSRQSKHVDYVFIAHMLLAGDIKAAWRILTESGFSFWNLPLHTRARFMDEIGDQHYLNELRLESKATLVKLEGELGKMLLDKYVHDLELIEERLGVEWISDGIGSGWHVLRHDWEKKLEELGNEHFGKQYGFFDDEERVMKGS